MDLMLSVTSWLQPGSQPPSRHITSHQVMSRNNNSIIICCWENFNIHGRCNLCSGTMAILELLKKSILVTEIFSVLLMGQHGLCNWKKILAIVRIYWFWHPCQCPMLLLSSIIIITVTADPHHHHRHHNHHHESRSNPCVLVLDQIILRMQARAIFNTWPFIYSNMIIRKCTVTQQQVF